MFTINIYLLLSLLICHWAADFTQLSTPTMLAAKKTGRPLYPIWNHAACHALLMIIVMTVYLAATRPHLEIYFLRFGICAATIWISHFLIDVWKGRMNVWFPALTNPANVYHWWIFGIDQFLHATVIIFVTIYIS